jgi:hypothetical protein
MLLKASLAWTGTWAPAREPQRPDLRTSDTSPHSAQVDADHAGVLLEGEVTAVAADDDGGVVEDVVEPAGLGDDGFLWKIGSLDRVVCGANYMLCNNLDYNALVDSHAYERSIISFSRQWFCQPGDRRGR